MGTTMGATTSPSTTVGTSNTTSSSSSSTTGGASNVPPDGSAASITAFLDAESYKDAAWLSVHDAPSAAQPGSPHGEVKVYLSPELVAFRQANDDLLDAPAVPGSMAVKELYDAGTVVGKAVIFYPGADVVYYCYGPAGRCASGSLETTSATALWGEERATPVSQCNVCHGGNVFTELP